MFRFHVGFLAGCLALAGAAAAQGRTAIPEAVACNNDNDTCRENCTIEFGSSLRTRAKLGVCLETCRDKHDRCTEQWTELHRNNLDVPPEATAEAAAPSDPAPAVEGRTRYTEDETAAAEPAGVQEGDVVAGSASAYNDGISMPSDEQLQGRTKKGSKRGKTKTKAQLKEEPPPPPRPPEVEEVKAEEPPPAPAPKKKAEEPAPAPEKTAEKPKKSSTPDVPPEPKHDISEWDPDGD